MQSQLTGFGEGAESNTSASDGASPVAAGTTVFSGEIDPAVLEPVARHVAGAFDYLHLSITADTVLLQAYETGDPVEDNLSQTVELSRDEWTSFNFDSEAIGPDTYTGLIQPYEGLYKAFSGVDVDELVSVEITAGDGANDSQGRVDAHACADGPADAGSDAPQHLDSLAVDETTSPVLRNPNYDALSVGELSYHTDVTLDAIYDVKQWLSDIVGARDDAIVLITASNGARAHAERAGEYVLSFTAVDVENWEEYGKSLVLTGSEMLRDEDEISDVNVSGTHKHPTGHVKSCIPDGHTEANMVCWGFYRPEPLHGLLKHVLKDSFTDGDFTFQMSRDFPLSLTHELTTAVEAETNVTVESVLAPVISPN